MDGVLGAVSVHVTYSRRPWGSIGPTLNVVAVQGQHARVLRTRDGSELQYGENRGGSRDRLVAQSIRSTTPSTRRAATQPLLHTPSASLLPRGCVDDRHCNSCRLPGTTAPATSPMLSMRAIRCAAAPWPSWRGGAPAALVLTCGHRHGGGH